MRPEPILRPEDIRAWDTWQRAARLHARTRAHIRAVDRARRLVVDCLDTAPNAAVMWSGGKDSTAMTHLACVEMGARMPVYSEKDDLDYPGEREYVERLAAAWELDLRILTPPVSPAAWLAEHGRDLEDAPDVHSRAAGLSKACFYDVVEAANAGHDAILLGLRQEESHGRRMNRATKGPLYRKAPSKRSPVGQWVCTPIVDWSGLDVYAYLAAHEIEPLPVYRCIAFMHEREPWHVRKSWWVPGSHAAKGGAAWLRHYYPSLFRQLCEWIPAAGRLG